jgi:UDP-N-acetylglucosamine 2-epimerase (non-hydrolysing)
MVKVLTAFGTRPEIIKLAPVIGAFEASPETFRTINVASGQHDGLAQPFIRLFGIRVDHDLRVMEPGQTPSGVCARILQALDPLLAREQPDVVVVQGDTTTALAAGLASFHRKIPVAHVEAGLRSGDPVNPHPEEMNRRLLSRLATWHFAATAGNRAALLREGVDVGSVVVTGNPVVDALQQIRSRCEPGSAINTLLARTEGRRRIVLTTHRRESFGARMVDNLRQLRRFVDHRDDTVLIMPVHPNPAVVEAVRAILAGHERIHLLEPLEYQDFVHLISQAWLIVSDSGGVQEEAPSLGRPVLVLRENTERPEALAAGVARLVGGEAGRLTALLEEAWQPGSWAEGVASLPNPFGQGDAGRRIASVLGTLLLREASKLTTAAAD